MVVKIKTTVEDFYRNIDKYTNPGNGDKYLYIQNSRRLKVKYETISREFAKKPGLYYAVRLMGGETRRPLQGTTSIKVCYRRNKAKDVKPKINVNQKPHETKEEVFNRLFPRQSTNLAGRFTPESLTAKNQHENKRNNSIRGHRDNGDVRA